MKEPAMDASTTDVPDGSPVAESRSGPLSLGRTVRTFFSYPSPRILAIQLVLAAAVRPFLGPFGRTDALIVAAVVVYWPIQEWVLHRLVLHARPRSIGRLRID